MNPTQLSRRLLGRALGLVAATLVSVPALGAVGRTEGSHGVSKDGAAVYTIPIGMTEGINGMTPRLAISYAGPGTRSILGVGFALSGISYITPCRKTIAQDTSAAPITLTSADRYCLDGARLRSLSTATYGATGTQYRTEIDQLVRVTSMASTNNIPGWFSVEMPDGLTYEYGNSTTSKLMSGSGAGATPQFWAVSKIKDRNGNEIDFTYDADAAQRRFRPDFIAYTQRGGSGHYLVDFVYQATTLPFRMQRFTPSIIGGAAHEHDKLLDRIDLKHDGATYRAYKFTYQAGAGDNRRLATVEECAYTPAEDCLEETQFSWQSATAGHNNLTSTTRVVAAGVIPLDINGDGIEDLAWAKSGTWRYMLGGASGFGAIQNSTVTATNPSKAMPLEWNGDGFWDLLIDWSDGNWRVLRGGASGFNTTAVAAGPGSIPSTTPNTSWTVADVDADGRDDLISVPLNAALTINVRLNGASGFGASSQLFNDPFVHTKASNPFIPNNGSSSAIRRPDFNGDGRTDLLIYGCIWETEPPGSCITDRWFQILSSGSTFTNEGPIASAAFNIHVRYGDFNGDGLTDAIYPATTGVWNVGLGQGSGGFSIVAGPSSAAHVNYQTLTGDYDGDGLDDFYVARTSPAQWEIFRGTGTGLASTATAPSPAISTAGAGWMLIDQNGDSLPDLGRYDSTSLVWSLGTHKGLPAERLLTATDGLANAVTFAYLPMTNATVYAKGTGAVYPEREFRGSAPLVRTMQVSPAGGIAHTFTYKYLNARIHGQGRSFLGMGNREVTDSRNNVFATETYRQTFPTIGAPASVTVKQSSGSTKIIQSQTHTYLHHVLESAAGKERYLPYRSQTVTNGHEVGGVRDGSHITQVTETHTVNTWGNSTFVSVDVKDMDALSLETGLTYRTEVVSTFVQDSTNWCIGPLLTRRENRIRPGGVLATREASWQVDAAECRVTQETIEPNLTSVESLVTDIFYDSCGNVNQLSSKPAGTTGLERVTILNHASRCQRPEAITNPEGHVTALFYNWALALPSKHRDPNSLDTDLEYDGFGRLTRQLRPDGTAARFALTACTVSNSWCGKNSGARVKVTRTERNTSNGILRTDEQFLDGLGRTRWTHGDSLETGPAIVETLYDAFGRPIQQTQPYFAAGAVYPTVLTRDLIGRVTVSNAPISEAQTSGRITRFDYEGRNLRVTDPATLITTRTSNVIGELTGITDPGTGGLTEYTYHPFGELASITDTNGHITGWTVNSRGLVTNTSDPDSGNWTYRVNAFGETTGIRDAKTASGVWTTEFTFDDLSRPLTRTEAEGPTTFTWGVAADNTATAKYIGRLKKVTSPGGYEETNTFDQYGRLTQLRTKIETINYDVDQSYSTTTGLPLSLTYPTSTGSTRFKLDFAYQNNRLLSVAQNGGTTTYWTGNSTDAWGHYQDELFGNGILAITDFDQASGLMAGRIAGVGGGTGRIDSIVQWNDLRRNVSQRQDLKLTPTVTEAFVNDSISRLDFSTRNGSQNLDLSYDANGNILTKDGQTYVYTRNPTGCTYNFPHLQPRAVHKIGSTVYCYDANGNMNKRAGSTITYASYNLPTVINQGSNSSTLSYGAFRNRYKQVAVSSGATETTIYVAGLFEKVTLPGGTTEYRHYIPGGNGTAAIHTRRSTGTNSTYYWHADHLGSPELFTDTGATALVRPSFGAFGERRDGTDWIGPPSGTDMNSIAGITRRGFTGHEHLDSVGLIHMNGRVYDPAIGRFLSVDPILRGGNSQSPNSYAYVLNNPLALIDPSGFTDEDVTDTEPGPQYFPQCPYQIANIAVDCPYNYGWRWDIDPIDRWLLEEERVDLWVISKRKRTPISNGNAWDGKSFGGTAAIHGVDSTVGGLPPGVPDWASTSGICHGSCHGTTPEGSLRPMTAAERLVLDGIGIVITAPVGGVVVGPVRAGIAAKGTATVLEHAGNHASVIVRSGSTVLHTEQMVRAGGQTTISAVEHAAPVVRSLSVSLPDAAAAVRYQQSVLGQATGTYNLATNSCVTHCGDVLRAGGLEAPSTTRAIIRWLRGLAGD